MAAIASFGSWMATLLASLIAAVGCSAPAYGGPPVNDHARETAQMAAELGFPLDYDEPPKPERITKPIYPRRAFDACVEGTVLLIGIDATGSVSASKVVESRDGLDEAALACVKNWRFKPARKGGIAVGNVAVAPVLFRIYNDKGQGPQPMQEQDDGVAEVTVPPKQANAADETPSPRLRLGVPALRRAPGVSQLIRVFDGR